MMPEFVTIGVYGFDEAGFFQALQDAGVDTFCDIRRRRGVRGSAYAFANSQRLQGRLAELGIRYIYRSDLAPSWRCAGHRRRPTRRAKLPSANERSWVRPLWRHTGGSRWMASIATSLWSNWVRSLVWSPCSV